MRVPFHFRVEGCEGGQAASGVQGAVDFWFTSEAIWVEMTSKSKSQLRVKDRLSDLPDLVLCHILSFIPTKYAARTSILSTRWKKVWASVPILDFDDAYFPNSESFLMFVNRVLIYRNSSDIQKFDLECNCVEHLSHIDGWIRSAIMSNPVELYLCVQKLDPQKEDEILELPKSLFMCKTLVVLELRSRFIINTPTSWCLPRLKVLVVTVNYPDKDPMEKLLPCCPALVDLNICGNVGEDVYLNFNVAVPELKMLRIALDTGEDCLPCHNDCNLFIRAPKLKNFHLVQCVLSNCVLENSESLVKATIDLDYHLATENPAFAVRATALLAQICNVKYLSLSAHSLDGCVLPVFGNLNQLKLVLHRCCSWWAELLKRSPNLESLVLEHVYCNCDGLMGYGIEETELLWDPPELVPNCLLSHVKTICIKGFSGRPDEFEVAKYLLKNGEVLSSMKVYTFERRGCLACKKEEMLKKLLTFERVSKTCQVEIA